MFRTVCFGRNLLRQKANTCFVCVCSRGTSDLSAVCAYKVSEMSKVFSEGKYKSPVPIETSFIKWVTFSGEVPFPRPGAVSLPVLLLLCESIKIEQH